MSDGGAEGAAFRAFAPRPYARARVLLFPHGGGSASYYRSWAKLAPWDVEFVAVQYPGREDRFADPVPSDLRSLAAGLAADARAGGSPVPVVLFGHSMGAVVAYEYARCLAARGGAPARLVVSGHPAPPLARPGTVHLGTDDELVDELRRTGATHLDLLDEPALIQAFLPVIRNDYRMSETYRHVPGERLPVPVTVLYGDRDTEVDTWEARGWSEITRGTCESRVFDGGHFYLDQHRELVVELLTAAARTASDRAAVPWPSMP